MLLLLLVVAVAVVVVAVVVLLLVTPAEARVAAESDTISGWANTIIGDSVEESTAVDAAFDKISITSSFFA
jgi:preprotein translocase subunit SecG